MLLITLLSAHTTDGIVAWRGGGGGYQGGGDQGGNKVTCLACGGGGYQGGGDWEGCLGGGDHGGSGSGRDGDWMCSNSRTTPVSHLKEALQGQEFELEQVRILLQEFGEGAYLEVYKELKAWQLEGCKCGE
ncbi:hypothetical protein C5167_005218 [Papaver somniferum]|uniref:Uncharacterized protein n=1 Tax=Papaver somniferum TaxID=3469 RepID=A0A4Y7JE50_PAPSO|nr:hypothetical protein C5167_005218 [Papaver somniferum]